MGSTHYLNGHGTRPVMAAAPSAKSLEVASKPCCSRSRKTSNENCPNSCGSGDYKCFTAWLRGLHNGLHNGHADGPK